MKNEEDQRYDSLTAKTKNIIEEVDLTPVSHQWKHILHQHCHSTVRGWNMMRFVHEEQSEITMDHVDLPDASARSDALQTCSGKDGGVIAAVPGETENLQLNKHLDL